MSEIPGEAWVDGVRLARIRGIPAMSQAAFAAGWALGRIEGRRQAAADIRARSVTGEWAARIAEGVDGG